MSSAHIAAKDGDDRYLPANCGTAMGTTRLSVETETYFCANCFDIERLTSRLCEWCNELNTGDMEHSYSTGCSHCEGDGHWEKDD
jgi:hypothetical protein